MIEIVHRQLEKYPELTVNKTANITRKNLAREVRNHVTLYQSLASRTLYGFENIQERLHQLIRHNSSEPHQAIVLHGMDGSGKQALATHCCTVAEEMFGTSAPPPHVIVRYVGATESCRSIHDLLLSVCGQIQSLLNRDDDKTNVKHYDTNTLKKQFNTSLDLLSKTKENGAFVVIDGLHKLQEFMTSSAVDLQWLATELPPRAHLIVTLSDVLPHQADALKQLRTSFTDTRSILQVPALALEDVRLVADDVAAAQHRMLSEDEEKIILHVCKENPEPLVAQLITDELLKTSGRQTKSEQPTLIGCIEAQFDFLEQRYSTEVIAAICCHLNAANIGLTEMELQDILSCNNALLLHVHKQTHYTYDVTTFDSLRFPTWLLHAILNDMKILLHMRTMCEKPLITLAHRHMRDVILRHYVSSSDNIKEIHSNCSDLFSERWLGNKPLISQPDGLAIYDTGNRFVCPQPLLYSETRYNLRRLHEHWYHLLHVGEEIIIVKLQSSRHVCKRHTELF